MSQDMRLKIKLTSSWSSTNRTYQLGRWECWLRIVCFFHKNFSFVVFIFVCFLELLNFVFIWLNLNCGCSYDALHNNYIIIYDALHNNYIIIITLFQEDNTFGMRMVFSYNVSRDMTNQHNECAPSEDSDQPGHPPSVIRVFAVRMKKAWVLSYPLSAQRRLWSDWADAQADLSHRWAHSHFVGFVMSRLIWENVLFTVCTE